jgi:hypothetical protein
MNRIVLPAVTAALLGLSAAGQLFLRSHRPESAPALTEGVLAAMGSLRSIAAEAVWFRADRLQEEGRYVELAQLASTLAFLEPHTPEVWSFAAWNLAYNISVMMPTAEDRWRWVAAAIRLLRDEGLRMNPREAEIYRELAWMFQLKPGTDIDSASAVYRALWKKTVDDVALRGAWAELGMKPTVMAEIARLTGMDDYSDPMFSAVYWATLGLPYAKGKEVSTLKEIIRQSRHIYGKRKADTM